LSAFKLLAGWRRIDVLSSAGAGCGFASEETMTSDLADQYVTPTLVPPWPEWSDQLAANRSRSAWAWQSTTVDDIRRLHSRILHAAREYEAALSTAAEQHGIELPTGRDDQRRGDLAGTASALIMTGHQPTILHPGLVFKFQLAARAAHECCATAIAILMDTDEGDAGAFQWPSAGQSGLHHPWNVAELHSGSIASGTLHSGSIAAGTSALFLTQRVRSADEVADLCRRVEDELARCGRQTALAPFRQAMADYQRLAGCSAVDANSLVRRRHRLVPGLLELPMSKLCAMPEVRSFLCDLLQDCRRLHQVYNQSLKRWRSERGIANPANPFPNLAERDGQLELPLWLVDTQTGDRSAIWTRQVQGRVELLAGGTVVERLEAGRRPEVGAETSKLLVPRGAMITVVLRLLGCDLFVHGTGGSTYDRFTDELIRDYIGIVPPAYVVASASRFLFADQRAELSAMDDLAGRQRDLVHHAESYLGQGVFSQALEAELAQLTQQKHTLVQRLRELKQAGNSAAAEGRALHQLQQQIKSRVSAEFAERLQPLARLTPSARRAIESRLYPWFFFSWDHVADWGAPS
jgi:hypothetical protein